MDFHWLKGLLSRFGWDFQVPTLARAEAWARPRLSRFLQAGTSTESQDTLSFYARELLEKAAKIEEKEGKSPSTSGPLSPMPEFLKVLRREGNWDRLWSRVPEGLPEALETFKESGRCIGIISNADGTVSQKLERAGLLPYFHFVIDSGLVGVEKPDPGIFQLALRRSGLSPERVLYVGDLYAVDVLGARGAGIEGALVDPFGDWAGVDCPTRPSATVFLREL